MRKLVPFAVDRTDITPYIEALAARLDGHGPALAPYEAGTAAPAVAQHPADAPDDLALVVATSGTTGTPKRAMLTRSALLASAHATHERIGGAGTWLLPLPPHHIAGTQVIVRSLVAGTTPIVLPEWSLAAFVKATTLVARNAPPSSPIHTSLVPTQLRDILTHEAALVAARRYRSILVGGAATSARLRERATEAGLPIRTTYGSSETSGGCVYDGVPLEGAEVRILDPDDAGLGRVVLAGPMLASGYLNDPERTSRAFTTLDDGTRAFVTDDLGRYDGRLHIDGRADDIIVTGGYKVAPRMVEEVVASLPGVHDVVVTGVPDERWGQAVAVAVVPSSRAQGSPGTARSLRADVAAACAQALPPYAVPKLYATFDSLPHKGIGKPDRVSVGRHTRWHNLR